MSELTVFEHEQFGNLRTVKIDGEAWFVGKDVAEALGYSNSSKAVIVHVDDNDKTKEILAHSQNGNMVKTQTTLINESGMYALIFGSKLESAKKFKHWVTSEVLPTIRKHGAYMNEETLEQALTSPDFLIQLATQLKAEKERRLVAEQRVGELKPKADYCDRILENKSLVPITYIAKDYGMSAVAFNKLLHDLGVQFKQGKTWFLYSKHQAKGWTQSETTIIERADGTEKAVMNTKWTQKGRLGLYELLKAHDVLPTIEQE